jgi:hypothetical protein
MSHPTVHQFRSFALISPLILLMGCGGGSGSGQLVAVPSFTSTPNLSANEGSLYSYQVTASDSSGAPVTLSLVSAPLGATLQDNKLSWTPTAAQARVANTFSITAITSSGGKATQAWSVTPTGTVRGKYMDTFWYSNGSLDKPHDLSQSQCSWCSFSALVPQPDGSLQMLPGTGKTDGTFEIPNVPGGYYWLQISSQPQQMFWTSSSTFDLGRDFVGKPSIPVSAVLAFDLVGLSPWREGDSLSIFNLNTATKVNLITAPLVGSSIFNGSESLNIPVIDPEKGDRSYILQFEPLTPPLAGQSLRASLYLPDLAVNGSSTTHVTGTLTSNLHTLELQTQRSEWVSLFNGASPSAAVPYIFRSDLSVQPLTADRFAPPRVALVRLDPQSIGTTSDWNYGALDYTDPFPPEWLRVFSIDEIAVTQIPLPDTNATFSFLVSAGHQVPYVSSFAIAPVMSPVRNATVNGMSLQSGATANSRSLTLRWSPPDGLSTYGYVIQTYRLTSSSQGTKYYEGPLATLCTAETYIVVPSGLLSSGNTYLFRIQARSDALANMQTSPFRSRFPIAYADSVSGPVSID